MVEKLVCPEHHPSEARLLDYAAGSLPEPIALLVATHLALCPSCRRDEAALEQLGGLLLDELAPAPLAEDLLERLLGRLEHDDAGPDERPSPRALVGDPDVPEPLQSYLGRPVAGLPWRRLGPVGHVQLLTDFPGVTTRLLSIRAGAATPSHTHDGCELTLVLRGAFADRTGHYGRGDVMEADGDLDHQPVADDGDDCLCLTVQDAPLRLTGRFGRLVNPFVRL